MKIKSLILAMAVCFGFTACSNDDDNINDGGTQEGTAYASFSFMMPNASAGSNTKADGDKVAGTLEESYMTDVTLLFFGTDGILKEKKQFVAADFSSVISGGDALYTKKASFTITKGTYNVYAFVNSVDEIKNLVVGANISSIQGISTLTSPDLTTSIAANKKFAMSNAETVITTEVNGTQATPTIIKIKVERAVAKVVDATPTTSFITTGGAHPGSQVTFVDMALVNQNKSYYHLKRVADNTGSNIVIGGAETAANYVIDPNFTSVLAEGASFFNPSMYSNNIIFPNGLNSTIYCAENTVNIPASVKENITTIWYKAKFQPNGIATEQDGTFYVFGGTYYGTTEEIKAAASITADVTTWTVGQWKEEGVDSYKGGICYYNAYLRHTPNGSNTEIGVMEYGVVRNNVYQAKVNSVKDLGSTVPGEGPDPELQETYATVIVQVMPWTVRVNDFDL